MVAADDGSRELELPRGLRLRVHYRTADGHDGALDAIIRRLDEGSVTLSLRELPSGGRSLRGKSVSLTARLHGRAYTMSSTVLAVEERPPMLVVIAPTEAQVTENRGFYRLNCNIEAQATWLEAASASPVPALRHRLEGARLLDISGGGALVRTREGVPVGAQLHLTFSLESDGEPLSVDALALRVEPEERGQAYRINTKFEELSPRTQEQLVRFIFREQALLSRRRSQ